MLFNSYVFLFAFLPVALAGFFAAGRIGKTTGIVWLVLCSLFFYAYWNVSFLPFLLGSIALNFLVSQAMQRSAERPSLQTAILSLGIFGNIAALCYFKYLAVLVHALLPSGALPSVDSIVLPLGISFFTFTQIGYLIDTKQGVSQYRGLTRYSLFVTFFPHLIAGPILHNREMMPQFEQPAVYRASLSNLSIGLTIFAIGLMKKCLLADPNAAVVEPGFAHPEHLQLFSAWTAALAYQFQIYFDFSGYSDMAIGLARMFNLRFPVNFNSPFKASSPIDFWQRWHMTLTRYLTLYLFSPIALAISRWRARQGLGTTRKAQRTPGGFSSMVILPTLVTMGLAGIWHGAGLQYLVFGLLHGTYLCANHAWRVLLPPPREANGKGFSPFLPLKVCLTFLATLVAIIYFRAATASSASSIVMALVGSNGVEPLQGFLTLGSLGGLLSSHASELRQIAWFLLLFVVTWACPNTQEIMRSFEPVIGKVSDPHPLLFAWRPNFGWAALIGAGLGTTIGIFVFQPKVEFLYFQF